MSAIVRLSGARRVAHDHENVLSVEWPTLAVAGAIYLGFGALTLWHSALPDWLLAVLGGYVVAWHGSLQHEVVHGHPTRCTGLNVALVLPSPGLWLPFRRYRESHLRHHREAQLTWPDSDPESYYLKPDAWRRLGPARRALLHAHNTLLGRLTLGPPLAVWRFYGDEWRRWSSGAGDVRAWTEHAVGVALVLAWVTGVCGLSPLDYILLFVYPGTALTLLRSFAEHRARTNPEERTIVIESRAPLALMFLNNNLHAVHHRYPGLAWYRLPARWRAEREAILRANGRYTLPGYLALARRYLLQPKEPVAHPYA